MKRLAVIRFAVNMALFASFSLSQSSATSPSIPSLVIDGQVDIIGELSPGNEFDIVFKFTLRPEGNLYSLLQREKTMIDSLDQTDSATIPWKKVYMESRDTAYIRPNNNIEFLSANGWGGKLIANTEVILKVRARLKKDVKTQFVGSVHTLCTKNLRPDVKNDYLCETTNIFPSYKSYLPKNPEGVSTLKIQKIDTLKNGVIIKQVSRLGPPPDSSMRVKKSDSTVSIEKPKSKSGKKKSNDKKKD